MMTGPRHDVQDFLKKRDEYRLGDLLTETPHGQTTELSSLAQEDLVEAYRLFKKIDFQALHVLTRKEAELSEVEHQIADGLKKGHRLFLCGCGATGRLALTLERCWREASKEKSFPFRADQVVAFMAGGDLALVKSIESFEDREDFGAKQLEELGFRESDLFIGISEGGETPFVIGASERAAQISSRDVLFFYANPDQQLVKSAERSKRLIENPKVFKVNLTHGPQALAGSTRLQASSVLMMALGASLGGVLGGKLNSLIQVILSQLEAIDYEKLTELTFMEQQAVEAEHSVYYTGPPEYLISIFTDTTERSPTFSLNPFEHDSERDQNHKSLCYLYAKEEDNTKVWNAILGRSPRVLNWSDVKNIAGMQRLLGHDFSLKALEKRSVYFKGKVFIEWVAQDKSLKLIFPKNELTFLTVKTGIPFFDLALEQLVIKLVLNAHSTLLMGRLKRYEGNLMTYVRPSNYKLVDRACRYAAILLQRKGIKNIDEKKLIQLCFDCASSKGAVVLNMVQAYEQECGPSQS